MTNIKYNYPLEYYFPLVVCLINLSYPQIFSPLKSVGAFLGGYIILYGQVQSWTPQLVTGPLGQTPPNKLTEVLWGIINCIPTLVMGLVMSFSPVFLEYNVSGMIGWLISSIVAFAIIFAINSSIHSYLVVKYAKSDKVAVSVGFYYMSNALGRLMGTIGSGLIFTYVGEYFGEFVGHDGTAGLAASTWLEPFRVQRLHSSPPSLMTMRVA